MTKFPEFSLADLLVHHQPKLKALYTRRQIQRRAQWFAKRLVLAGGEQRPPVKNYSNFQILQWAKERAKQ